MSNSEFQLTFEDRGSYLYAHLTGRDSFAASLDYWHQITGKAKELGYQKVLVHENLEGTICEGETFSLITEVVPSGIGIRVAFFDEHQSDDSINELGELMATNRGADFRVFKSVSDAVRWITC